MTIIFFPYLLTILSFNYFHERERKNFLWAGNICLCGSLNQVCIGTPITKKSSRNRLSSKELKKVSEPFSFPVSFRIMNMFIFFFFFLRVTPTAFGSSQARGLIRVTFASLHHSHSNATSEPCQRPTSQLTAKPHPSPLSKARDQTCNLMFLVRFISTVPQRELLLSSFINNVI